MAYDTCHVALAEALNASLITMICGCAAHPGHAAYPTDHARACPHRIQPMTETDSRRVDGHFANRRRVRNRLTPLAHHLKVTAHRFFHLRQGFLLRVAERDAAGEVGARSMMIA